MLAKMKYVVIEKWEGGCWDGCLANQSQHIPCDPSCHEEANQLSTLQAIKNLNASVPTVFYLNAVLDFNFLHLHAQYTAAGALLHNTDGSICHLTNDAGMANVTVYDFAQEIGRALWVDTVRNLTATGLVDGIYADQMQVYATNDTSKGKKGTWGLCKKSHHTCCEMTEEKATAYNIGKDKAMQEVAALLGPKGLLCAGGDTSIITSVIIRKNVFDPKKMQGDIKRALQRYSYVHIVQNLPIGDQKANHDPHNTSSFCSTNLIASFLLAVEPGAFIGCNGWDSGAMGKPLGKPQGQFNEEGSLLWRNFSSGTSVVWNETTSTGVVHWALS
jgi:hypothetical protein